MHAQGNGGQGLRFQQHMTMQNGHLKSLSGVAKLKLLHLSQLPIGRAKNAPHVDNLAHDIELAQPARAARTSQPAQFAETHCACITTRCRTP